MVLLKLRSSSLPLAGDNSAVFDTGSSVARQMLFSKRPVLLICSLVARFESSLRCSLCSEH